MPMAMYAMHGMELYYMDTVLAISFEACSKILLKECFYNIFQWLFYILLFH